MTDGVGYLIFAVVGLFVLMAVELMMEHYYPFEEITEDDLEDI